MVKRVSTNHQLRARRELSIFKDVPLRTRRVLSLYNVYGNSAILALNWWKSHINCEEIGWGWYLHGCILSSLFLNLFAGILALTNRDGWAFWLANLCMIETKTIECHSWLQRQYYNDTWMEKSSLGIWKLMLFKNLFYTDNNVSSYTCIALHTFKRRLCAQCIITPMLALMQPLSALRALKE